MLLFMLNAPAPTQHVRACAVFVLACVCACVLVYAMSANVVVVVRVYRTDRAWHHIASLHATTAAECGRKHIKQTTRVRACVRYAVCVPGYTARLRACRSAHALALRIRDSISIARGLRAATHIMLCPHSHAHSSAGSERVYVFLPCACVRACAH